MNQTNLVVALAPSSCRSSTSLMESAPPPVLPFDLESAIRKVRAAEDAWNTRDPERIAIAYTNDSAWRNRSEFLCGRDEIRRFLERKWKRELDYRLIKEYWAHGADRIGVRFAYEWHDCDGQWFRSFGNENWEFEPGGLMRTRHASINDIAIDEQDRLFRWTCDARPADHPGLSELGL